METPLDDAVATLGGQAIAVFHAANIVLTVALVLAVAGLVVTALGAWRGWNRQPRTQLETIPDLLDRLAASVAELNHDYANKEQALRDMESQHRRNEALVELTRQQAEAVRQEIASAVSKDRPRQLILFVASVIVAIILAIVGIIITK